MLLVVMCLCLLLTSVNAEVSSFTNSGEATTENLYRINHFIQYHDDFNDYVTEGQPLELQLVYSCEDIDQWNRDYSDFEITYVNLTTIEQHRVRTFGEDLNITETRTVTVLSDLETPFHNVKKFFSLYHQDTLTIELNTNYENQTIADTPCHFYIWSPTEDCNACSEYEYIIFEEEVTDAQNIKSNKVTVYNYIKRLIQINFEVVLILYWVILILIFIAFLTFIFYLITYFYRYVKRHVPK